MKNAWQVRLILLFPIKTAHRAHYLQKWQRKIVKHIKYRNFMNCAGKRYTQLNG